MSAREKLLEQVVDALLMIYGVPEELCEGGDWQYCDRHCTDDLEGFRECLLHHAQTGDLQREARRQEARSKRYVRRMSKPEPSGVVACESKVYQLWEEVDE